MQNLSLDGYIEVGSGFVGTRDILSYCTMWDAEKYLRFETERARPFFDLVAAVDHPHPRAVADLGCGPGGLTATLLARWPNAVIRARACSC